MIGVVKDDGVGLDVTKDIGIDMEFNNTVFPADGAKIPGSFSMPLIVPGTKHNYKSLQYMHCLDIGGKQYDYENVSVLFKQNKILGGKLVFTKISSLRYEGTLIVNGFPLDVFSKSLKDIDYGPDVSLGADNIEMQGFIGVSHYHDNYGDAKLLDISLANGPDERALMFQFPAHSNPAFYAEPDSTDSPNPQYSGFVNFFEYHINTTPVNQLGPEGEGPNFNKHVVVPWLYLSFIVEQIFKSVGYTLRGSFFNDFALKKILMYNNYALDRRFGDDYGYVHASVAPAAEIPIELNDEPTTYYRIPFFEDATDDDSDVTGCWNNIGNAYVPPIADNYKIIVDLKISLTGGVAGHPFVMDITIYNDTTELHTDRIILDTDNFGSPWEYLYVKDVDCYISPLTGTEFFHADIRISSLITPLTGTHIWVEGSMVVRPEYAPVWNQWEQTVHLVNHVPDMQVDEFISELCSIFNLRIVPDVVNKTVTLEFAELVFGRRLLSDSGNEEYFSNYIDLTAKADVVYDAEPPRFKRRKFQFNWDKEPLAENNFKPIPPGATVHQYNRYSQISIIPIGSYNVGDFIFVRSDNRYYKVNLDLTTGLKKIEPYTDAHYPYTKGVGETVEHSVSITPVLMGHFIPGFDFLMPRFNERGTSTAFEDTGINDFGAKLAFWHGIEHFSGLVDNTLCTSIGRTCKFGTPFTAYGLLWGEERSLNVAYWNVWEDFEQDTELVYRNIKFDINDIADFNFSKMWRIDQVDYIGKRVRAPIRGEGVGLCDCEMYRVI